MKPYGVKVIEFPDVADIQSMGAKGSVGKFAGKSGDYHPYSKGNSKKKTRRYWKKRARKIKVEVEC
jgi:hypothetical protein